MSIAKIYRRGTCVLVLVSVAASALAAECKVSVGKRKFEGAERTVITLENDRILAEIVPELEGRISRYVDKRRPTSAFEWLDDCAYHFAGRWEGKPFTYKVVENGPKRASVSVEGGGKIAVGLLHDLLGVDLASPLDLVIQRTMSIDAESSRLRVDVKITNTSEGVAPSFRYMVHAVFGQVPPMPEGRAFWFLPTPGGVEFFDGRRGEAEMGASAGGAPIDHRFSRFIPGRKADKPRYEAGGWGAALTSAGPVFMFYDPKQFDFMQYWFGGDSEWHLTFEPHTRPVDLKPQESVECAFTLAYDSKDVAFNTGTIAYQRPVVPEMTLQGGTLRIDARATTVSGSEQLKTLFEVKDPKGQVLLTKTVAGAVEPLAFTKLSAEVKLPQAAAMGFYTWKMSGADDRELAAGKFEIVTPEEQAKRQMAKATAEIRAKLDESQKKLQESEMHARKMNELWRDATNLAHGLHDPLAWPDGPPPAGVSVTLRPQSVRVLGHWQEKEYPRIKSLVPARPAAWPKDVEKLLDALKDERVMLRDVAPDASGKGLMALLVDAGKRRVEVVQLLEGRVARRFGRYAEKPGENDDALGLESRAIAVDGQGAVWVATNAWGSTSVFRRNPDGQPFEESIVGAKGAVKKFSPEGQWLASASALDTPMDLALAEADGTPVVLATYRSVSEYHGAQVREGLMILRAADAARAGEIKVPAGSVALASGGRIWTADVAGHVACYDLKGRKVCDAAESPPPAQLGARLPGSSPLPVVLRVEGQGNVCALFTLARKLKVFDAKGTAVGAAKSLPDDPGAIFRLVITPDGPAAIAEKAFWRP